VVGTLAQVVEIARCYPPQLEVGEYPGRDFIEVPEESTSAAPSPSRASKTKKQVADVIEDSEDLNDTHFSSGDDDDSDPCRAFEQPPPSLTWEEDSSEVWSRCIVSFRIELLFRVISPWIDCTILISTPASDLPPRRPRRARGTVTDIKFGPTTPPSSRPRIRRTKQLETPLPRLIS
jgi:hypothetical protein